MSKRYADAKTFMLVGARRKPTTEARRPIELEIHSLQVTFAFASWDTSVRIEVMLAENQPQSPPPCASILHKLVHC